MPNTEANLPATESQTKCPLCGAPLDPQNPTECPKCDWVVGYGQHAVRAGGTPRDVAALLMSVIPGLGHIYKGHRLTGSLLMLGGVFAVLACGLVATATAGFGLLLLPLYWAGVMMQVYWIEDRAAKEADQKAAHADAGEQRGRDV
ncbi:MAG: hypothetical protein M3463_10975 [Verrucomicrobiota bacterium]|nr:hypothetical protein [Verrucomicrobiota bacterium]